MRIHKEGRRPIIFANIIILISLFIFFYCYNPHYTATTVFVLLFAVAFLFHVIRFFRVPSRVINKVEAGVLSPADGIVIAIEETVEDEYFKDTRLKISIFMSVYNVHVNFIPIDGVIEYVLYHPGKYLVAKYPKSSVHNEHNTVVVRKNEREVVLFRQIAGFVARRIVSYVETGETVSQGEEMGIIRFGSRVDVFLPTDVEIAVRIGELVRAQKSVLAYF